MTTLEIILPLLFITAFLYSSVGHGGASGYLACMALAGISPMVMRPSALILNLFVAGVAFVSFYRAGYFKWRLFWPFAVTSVPAAFFGSQLAMNPTAYKIILGICLFIAVARMLYKAKDTETVKKIPLTIALIIGLILGLISGMIGIGGGIILSPLLIIFRWSTIKESAAISALFIFFNSISGLAGLIHKGFAPQPSIALWIAIALMGGIAGAYFGSRRFSITGLKYALAIVLCFAALKLIIQ